MAHRHTRIITFVAIAAVLTISGFSIADERKAVTEFHSGSSGAAVLYEEDGSSEGRKFIGSARWRSENNSSENSSPGEEQLRIDVDIPERYFNMAVVFRRKKYAENAYKLEFEMQFSPSSSAEAVRLKSIPGILMKSFDSSRGKPLFGESVKESDNVFSITLSSDFDEKIINYKLIMARDFIDIAINYENGRRSILAIGKDVEGQKIFRGIYEKWSSIKDIKPHSLETEEFETTYKIKDGYSNLIKINPKDARAFYERGVFWLENELYEKALSDFTEAIKLNGKIADYYFYRAAVWSRKNIFSNAIDDLNEAIKLDPNKKLAYYNRGNAWYKLRVYDLAIDDFTKAAQLSPNDAQIYYNLGVSWAAKRDDDKAIEQFSKAIKLDPLDSDSYFNRANSLANKHESEKAIADYSESININPKQSDAFNNRGNSLVRLKQYDNAFVDFDEAIKLDQKNEKAYYNRGNAWNEKGVYDKAISDYDAAIQLNSKYAIAYNNRGNAWRKKGSHDKAILDYNEAISFAGSSSQRIIE